MKYRLAWGLLAALVLVGTPARAVDQDAIDRAIEKGVAALRKLQQPDGTWQHQYIGATALAGLTLLECGADKDDKDVLRAADAVRKASIDLTHTYSISLALLFLDRLGDREDESLIKSLMARLLAGQDASSGGWSYGCPPISAGEKQQLQENLNNRKKAPAREQPRGPERGAPFPQRGPGAPGFAPFPVAPGDITQSVGGAGDNSNTQFAALGLWVGRRHGVPIDQAAARLANRFRRTQMEDGGWYYDRPIGMPSFVGMPGMGSTPSMTCAGLIALAIADGAAMERATERRPDAKLPDISKDTNLSKGLEALSAVIDNPKGINPGRQGRPFGPPGGAGRPERPAGPGGPPGMPAAHVNSNSVGGRTYYFLWSLERVAVALDLKTIGNKDWFNWGAEILLENQSDDGTWNGVYADGGVDTCFALLFLRRANLVHDLTARIKGKIKDPGERTLSGGGGRGKLGGRDKMLSGIESKDSKSMEKPLLKATSTESNQLANSLLSATGQRRDEMLDAMEKEKGVKYTEALALAIPRLEGDTHRRAREALANRLTRMKDDTLQEYFQDEDPEIRRAAAIAAGQKDSKALVPYLIALLRDPDNRVIRAAHASLKSLTAKDFGPAVTATPEQRDLAVQKWLTWWSKQRKE